MSCGLHAAIAEEIVEMCFPAGVADLFFNAFEATEFSLGASPRLFRWDEKAGLQRDAIRSQCSTCSRHKKGDRR